MEILKEKLDFYRGAGRIKKKNGILVGILMEILETKKILASEIFSAKILDSEIFSTIIWVQKILSKNFSKNSLKKILEPLNSQNNFWSQKFLREKFLEPKILKGKILEPKNRPKNSWSQKFPQKKFLEPKISAKNPYFNPNFSDEKGTYSRK